MNIHMLSILLIELFSFGAVLLVFVSWNHININAVLFVLKMFITGVFSFLSNMPAFLLKHCQQLFISIYITMVTAADGYFWLFC